MFGRRALSRQGGDGSLYSEHSVQWSPVNTVTNGPRGSGHTNWADVLTVFF